MSSPAGACSPCSYARVRTACTGWGRSCEHHTQRTGRSGCGVLHRRAHQDDRGDVMFHPFIQKAIGTLLVISGAIFASLMVLTVVGVVLIELNGGVV